MEENEVFLKYLIDEEIYIIDENTAVDPEDKPGSVDDNTITQSQRQQSRQIPDVKVKNKVAGGTDQKEDTIRATDGDIASDEGSSSDIKEFTDTGSTGEQKESKRYKNTTVLLLDYDDPTSMIPEHEDLLVKILQSVHLDADSVQMVFQGEISKLEVNSFINCTVIAFLQSIPRHIDALFVSEKYMINNINESQFVACDTLNDLSKNRSLKKKLWEQLKLIYRI